MTVEESLSAIAETLHGIFVVGALGLVVFLSIVLFTMARGR